jgi:hypothetical protein
MSEKRSNTKTSNTRFYVKNQYSIKFVHLQQILNGQICPQQKGGNRCGLKRKEIRKNGQ